MIKKSIFFTIMLIGSDMLAGRPSHAYIDPGTGSFILQILAAAFFGCLFTIKTFWQKIKNLFSRRSQNDNDQQQ